MKYTNKKKLIAMMALIITAASFGGCNSANTTATIDPEVTSSEIVSSAPVSSAETSSEGTSSEAVSSAPVSSEVEKPESEAASSEATPSAAEASSETEAPATSSEPTVSSAPATVSQPAGSSAPAAVSKPAATSQPVSSTVTSAPAAKTVSAPAQPQSGSTKAFEDMTIEEQDQWLLDQLNEQLASMEVHDSGIVERHSIESTQPAEDDGDDAERKALEKEKLEQLRQNLQGSQNEQKTEQEVSQTEEQEEYKPNIPEFDPAAYAESTVRLANKERTKNGLSEVPMDPELMRLASLRAEEAATLFSHTRPNGEDDCYTGAPEYEWVMCNLGEGYNTPESVVNGWMNSSGHKRNIMYPNHTAVGAGVYENGQGTRYWCIIFYSEGGNYPDY